MPTCGKCHEWIFTTTVNDHECAPAWEIWDFNDETREDARTIHGHDAEEVAQSWAARSDSDGDYSIVSGSAAVMCVSKVGSSKVQTLVVRGESVPEYHASEVKAADVKAVHDWNKKHPKGTPVRLKST